MHTQKRVQPLGNLYPSVHSALWGIHTYELLSGITASHLTTPYVGDLGKYLAELKVRHNPVSAESYDIQEFLTAFQETLWAMPGFSDLLKVGVRTLRLHN
jgi:hypothetical protein